MSNEQTVLEHLLDGRAALELEVARLTTAIEELDSVIAHLSGAAPGGATTATASTTRTASSRSGSGRSTTRRSAGKRAARSSARPDEGGKSIRANVLEILGSEDRDFGLAEIIDRISALGIQAHDDAVRSITIKLMKDGKVERVGRGQYRLPGRGHAGQPVTPAAQPDEHPVEPQPEVQNEYVPPMNFNQDPGY